MTRNELILVAAVAGALGMTGWLAFGRVTFSDLRSPYYSEFNRARAAIEQAVPAERLQYSGVNRDIFLEEFHFKATTESGRAVRLWFDGSEMDVRTVCERPAGIVFIHDAHGMVPNRYGVRTVAGWIGADTPTVSVADVLRNIDVIEERVRENTGDENDLLHDDVRAWDCLHVEFPSAGDREWFVYTGVLEKDVSEFP